MFNIMNLFGRKKDAGLSKDEAAMLLQVRPDLLDKFEAEYHKADIMEDPEDNIFAINSRQASAKVRENGMPDEFDEEYLRSITERIVRELECVSDRKILEDQEQPQMVTNQELQKIPKELRPQLTGSLYMCDLSTPSYPMLLSNLRASLMEKDPKKKQMYYHLFRQGLDILDLDPITYEVIGMNKNSMGYWFPALSRAVSDQDFFKVPKTKIVKVPLPILQLTRCDYSSLTPTTLKIVNDWAMKAFNLDVTKEYFVKTGTYSSKFDFRNCKVSGEKEVRELGEYLLFIHQQAIMMASPLVSPSIYGVSTTNEWVVREYIPDKENNPCIYHGMPLHTEYRFFVDFDTDEIIGVSPYWEPEMLKKRFSQGSDADSPHQIHDYVIIKAHEQKMMDRYYEHFYEISEYMEKLIPQIALKGQWSVDVMLNGDDVWIIDMATADTSALKECCGNRIRKQEENWIPKLKSE